MAETYRHLRIRYYNHDLSEDYYYEKMAHRKNRTTNSGKEWERLSREFSLLFVSSKRSKTYKKNNSAKFVSCVRFSNSDFSVPNRKVLRKNFEKNIDVRKQRCIFKCNFVYNKKKHSEFLRNYMQQMNKEYVTEKPILFSKDEEAVDENTLKNYEENIMDKSFYRFILSPESNAVPIESLVRMVMKQIERVTGYDLYWYAAKHTDTGHNHAHIAINGVDKKGKKVKFDSALIKAGIRSFAQDACTEFIGYRSLDEIVAEKTKMPYARRITKLDYDIKKYEVQVYGQDSWSSMVNVQNDLMKIRLETLEELKLAKKRDYEGKSYYLETNWFDKLKTIGMFNSFYNARNILKYVNKCNLFRYKKETGVIRGIITKIFRSNYEDSWVNAIVIENKKENKAWFVPLTVEPNNKLLKTTVEFGLNPVLNTNGKQVLRQNLRVLDWGRNR